MNQLNKLIYGRDPEPNIVSIAPLYGRKKSEMMRCFIREGDNITYEDHRYFAFFYVRHPKFVKDTGAKIIKLKGKQYYKYLAYFQTYKKAKEGFDRVKEITRKKDPQEAKWPGGREQQFLTQHGKTLFKGMEFGDEVVLALDIETTTEHGFPNAEREEDEIIIVSLVSNRGFKAVLHTNPALDCPHGRSFASEEDLLVELANIIVHEVDPDVLVGHNIYNFDISYIAQRYALYELEMVWGRTTGSVFSYPSAYRTAERINDFTCWIIPGRHVVDTLIALQLWDMVAREMPRYDLKTAARHFGFVKKDREYVDGKEIPKTWKEDPMRLLRYATDDGEESIQLYEHLLGSVFYMTQMMPLTYEKVARVGTGTKILSLFLREYFRKRHSVPKPEHGKQEGGGLTKLYLRGVIGPVVHADVESLYPSIMLNYNIQPERDELKLFPRFLKTLTDLRFEWKAKRKDPKFEARQQNAKLIINGHYGVCSFASFLFNDYSEGDRVASIGRDILQDMVTLIEQAEGEVIEIDTDGVYFIPPTNDEEEQRELVKAVSDQIPEGIEIGFDGRYQTMISYKAKNYALLNYDDEFKVKGSALISRGMPPFIVDFVRKGYRLACDQNVNDLRELYLQYRSDILYRRVPIGRLAEGRSLHKTLDQYVKDVNDGKSNKAAAYQLGIEKSRRGYEVRKGDKIWYYVAGTNPKVKVSEAAKLLEDFENDYNVLYYAQKLDNALDRFSFMFHEEDYEELFRVTGPLPVRLDGIEFVVSEAA